MKNFKLSLVLISVLSLFSFTGCFWQMSIFQAAKISSASGVGGPEKVLITWNYTSTFSNEVTNVSLEITPSALDGQSKFWTTSESSSYVIPNLDNDVTYSVKVQNYQSDGQFYSGTSCIVQPNASNYQEIDGSTLTGLTAKITKPFVEVKNVKGKYLSFANINTSTEKSIDRTTSMQWGLTDLGKEIVTTASGSRSAIDVNDVDVSAIFEDSTYQITSNGFRNFRAPEVDVSKFDFNKLDSSRAVTSTTATTTSTTTALHTAGELTDAQTGDKAYFYLDNDSNISKYVAKECVLRNVTTDSTGNKLFIWVEKNCWTTDIKASGKKVNKTLVDNLAKKFVKFAKVERQVYGNESNKIQLPSSKCSFGNMSNFSPTGNNVNIIIYDIGNDYQSSSPCGVLGYFHSKDYFQNSAEWGTNTGLETSNEGKFFYIDAPFCNYSGYNSATKTYEYEGNLLSQPSGDIVSTLFHEFQHMINYGNKTVSLSSSLSVNEMVRSSTWYNEMLSMLCEDMLQSSLGTSDDEAPRGGRLPTFNGYYAYSGIAEWSSEYAIISYSTAYAFGAWLARNFGGTDFITAVSSNSYVDMKSILAAIKSTTGKTYTQEDLMTEFMKGICVAPENAEAFNSTAATSNKILTMNCYGTGIIEIDGIEAEFSPINLYEKPSSTYQIEKENGTKKTKRGPVEYAANYSTSIGPYGFLYHQIGYFENATGASLAFDLSNNGDVVILFVQDQFVHYLEDK